MKNNLYDAPKARTDNIVVSEIKDELLLYCLKTDQAFCLNKTAAAVYQSADGIRSATEIADTLSEKLKSKITEDFVLFTLDELKSQNLVEFAAPGAGAEKINGFSRREAIKRIGLSTAVALPLVTMLVAPKAAEAQSVGACVAQGDNCTGASGGQGNCCTGLICCAIAGVPIPPFCFNGTTCPTPL